MKKTLLVLSSFLLLTACNKKELTQNLEINCNGNTSINEIKLNDNINCELLGENVRFKITNITNSSITIETTSNFLSSGPGIIDPEYKWEVTKDNSLSLHTNTTDYQGIVTFTIK